jgi:hypothetical protein
MTYVIGVAFYASDGHYCVGGPQSLRFTKRPARLHIDHNSLRHELSNAQAPGKEETPS